jgi:hypothetical protein
MSKEVKKELNLRGKRTKKMVTVHPQYITDSAGKKLVVLPIKEFNILMEELEDLDDIRLYDQAKASKEPSIPIDEAFKTIEAKRKRKK